MMAGCGLKRDPGGREGGREGEREGGDFAINFSVAAA